MLSVGICPKAFSDPGLIGLRQAGSQLSWCRGENGWFGCCLVLGAVYLATKAIPPPRSNQMTEQTTLLLNGLGHLQHMEPCVLNLVKKGLVLSLILSYMEVRFVRMIDHASSSRFKRRSCRLHQDLEEVGTCVRLRK